MKTSFHHEAHEDHEGNSSGYRVLWGNPKGELDLLHNTLFLFVYFVLFVVKLWNLGSFKISHSNHEEHEGREEKRHATPKPGAFNIRTLWAIFVPFVVDGVY